MEQKINVKVTLIFRLPTQKAISKPYLNRYLNKSRRETFYILHLNMLSRCEVYPFFSLLSPSLPQPGVQSQGRASVSEEPTPSRGPWYSSLQCMSLQGLLGKHSASLGRLSALFCIQNWKPCLLFISFFFGGNQPSTIHQAITASSAMSNFQRVKCVWVLLSLCKWVCPGVVDTSVL